jgi:protein tyrosine/serine phosphatase
MVKNLLRSFTISLTAILAFAAFTSAQTGSATITANTNIGAAATSKVSFTSPTSPRAFANVKIDNFGQMDDNYYRGAQPGPNDYKSLADLGIKTIIDLRNDPTDYEKSAAEAVGIKYINLPMSGWQKPSDSDIQKFLQIANDPTTGKFFAHCKAGIHRTGMTGAIYRMTKYGWTYDQAYQEMLNYHFTSGLVHGGLKSYVKGYSNKLQSTKPVSKQPVIEAKAAGAQIN